MKVWQYANEQIRIILQEKTWLIQRPKYYNMQMSSNGIIIIASILLRHYLIFWRWEDLMQVIQETKYAYWIIYLCSCYICICCKVQTETEQREVGSEDG